MHMPLSLLGLCKYGNQPRGYMQQVADGIMEEQAVMTGRSDEIK